MLSESGPRIMQFRVSLCREVETPHPLVKKALTLYKSQDNFLNTDFGKNVAPHRK